MVITARKILSRARGMAKSWQRQKSRRIGLEALAAFARGGSSGGGSPMFKSVLVDGMWDNANYWIRLALFARAVGLGKSNVVGVIGKWSRSRSIGAFERFGIATIEDYCAWHDKARSSRDPADDRRLLDAIKTSADVVGLVLPGGFPGHMLYDTLLKEQRSSTLQIDRPDFAASFRDAVASIVAGDMIVAEGRYDAVVVSHPFTVRYGALAWAALRRGIPVFLLTGDYNTNRFIRLSSPDEIWCMPGRPTLEDFERIGQPVRSKLAAIGRDYVKLRLIGRTSDLTGQYAYGAGTEFGGRELLDALRLDPSKPTVAVYSGNMLDYPHLAGVLPTLDYVDWARITVEEARRNTGVNWIFKPHPIDEFYGKISGPSVESLVAEANAANLAVFPKGWRSLDLIRAVNGIVTVHSTIGVEGPIMGKPVLTAYDGWYGKFGFVTSACSLEDYRNLLRQPWWQSANLERNAEDAAVFAGLLFAVPSWQAHFSMLEDAYQDAIWVGFDDYMRHIGGEFEREAAAVRDWVVSGHSFLQSFKLLGDDAPRVPTPRAVQSGAKDPRQA